MSRSHFASDDLIPNVAERRVRAVEDLDVVMGEKADGSCSAGADFVPNVSAREVRRAA